ncbi:probable serine/threonine-protein kinase DDB_G0282963 [Lucilia sericata]|uniref:probable serine/threonine-protein kinase DDB_G0282963 n=1 Tax=Lucilia sericata TaxID=13632 RepID=UPI0018A836A4|nr:probable serine/threonine-protein kinase DDB_G0282963 [Lucilia sericata]
MDIIDVDEALKDDSFIFLEDKTHDDISNILQQWKSNNVIPPLNNTSSHSQPQPQQQQQEQAYKYDSRTFTRPKRKSAQNLELQFTNSTNTSQYQTNNHHQQNAMHSQPDNPMFNLEIGGLVTNMHKSFLQDTSPPPFSSMDASMDRMNNSLITSADFSNINFLQSTNSLDFGGSDAVGFSNFNLTGKVTNDGYSLSDMIRDRKALESLTMSSDGTLIKDSHIGQIDDISLTLSKTASGCSTMDNSTESVEANNRTVEIVNSNMDRTFNGGVQLELASCHGLKTSGSNSGGNQIPNALQRTMILSDEMIGDITYNLVENSMYASIPSDQALSVTQNYGDTQNSAKENKPAAVLDETICLSTASGGADSVTENVKAGNSTFECQNITPDTRCETPEGVEKNIATMKNYMSTPHASSVRYNKHHYTPTLKMVYDGNISPIVPPTGANATRVLNETFENNQHKAINDQMNKTNIIYPTFDKNLKHLEQPSPSLEMKNVMDLAQAEANLLASNNNEEEFDHMLDEFSKVELNAEQLKMKKSLDSIKRRFNYGPNRDKSQQREISREAKDMRDMMRVSADILGEEDHSSKDYLNMTMDIVTQDDCKKSKEHLVESPHALSETSSDVIKSPLKDSVTTSSITDSKISNGLSLSSVSTASTGGERLLSRRSRLYDDFNMSTLSSSSMHGTKVSLGSSFTVHKEDDAIGDIRPNITNETENLSGQNPLEMVQEKTESMPETQSTLSTQHSDNAKESTPGQYRLVEKRERDRDRFKTIKINKNRNGDAGCGDGLSGFELNVPCIDDYAIDVNVESAEDSEQMNQRFSRRDQTASPVFNNNKSEVETNITNKSTSKINPNFLTYKKPKDKLQTNIRNLPEVAPAPTAVPVAPEVASSKPRSLSRPRYLSGLTKFSAVSKATSADELEKSIPRQTNLNATTSALNVGLSKGSSAANVSLNRTQVGGPNEKQSGELKSPMGIKSKSFHNLSSHHTYANNTGGGLQAPKSFGLKKPSATGISTEKLAKANPNRNSCLLNPSSNQMPNTQQKSDESVFKVPKLVSGIRAPGAAMQGGAAAKRAGLARPSSGYYSLTVTAKGMQPAASNADCEAGRQSPTDSMSSASSRGSAQSLNKTTVIKTTGTSNNSNALKSNTTAALTKITIGSTGIPKPSGLRPPSNIKRSGLPRPSSFIKTDK